MNTRITRILDKDGSQSIWIIKDAQTMIIHDINTKVVSITINNYKAKNGCATATILDIPNNRQAKRDAIARLIKALDVLTGGAK